MLDKEKIKEITCLGWGGGWGQHVSCCGLEANLNKLATLMTSFCYLTLKRPLRLFQSGLLSCLPYFSQEVQASRVMSCHLDSWICSSLIWSKFPTLHPSLNPFPVLSGSQGGKCIVLNLFSESSCFLLKCIVTETGLFFELITFPIKVSSEYFFLYCSLLWEGM